MRQRGNTVWVHRDRNNYNYYWPDPRTPLALHIGWERGNTPFANFSLPEPHNFNWAICSDRYLLPDFIRNAVFYLDQMRQCRVTVYYVPDNVESEFKVWIREQPWTSYWRSHRPVAPRAVKPLLHSRVGAVEISLEERLYISGYYQDLQNKYPGDIAEYISQRLGQPRGGLVTGGASISPEWDSSDEDTLYDF